MFNALSGCVLPIAFSYGFRAEDFECGGAEASFLFNVTGRFVPYGDDPCAGSELPLIASFSVRKRFKYRQPEGGAKTDGSRTFFKW